MMPFFGEQTSLDIEGDGIGIAGVVCFSHGDEFDA